MSLFEWCRLFSIKRLLFIIPKGFGRKWLWPWYCPYIHLEGVRKTITYRCQDGHCVGKDASKTCHKYNSGCYNVSQQFGRHHWCVVSLNILEVCFFFQNHVSFLSFSFNCVLFRVVMGIAQSNCLSWKHVLLGKALLKTSSFAFMRQQFRDSCCKIIYFTGNLSVFVLCFLKFRFYTLSELILAVAVAWMAVMFWFRVTNLQLNTWPGHVCWRSTEMHCQWNWRGVYTHVYFSGAVLFYSLSLPIAQHVAEFDECVHLQNCKMSSSGFLMVCV